MSHNENNPDLHTFIEPELEARVVAWVLGEASAFEAAELERLIPERPELAVFKRRIEAVHGLVGEAARSEKKPLRLAPDRRRKLLETFGSTEHHATAAKKGPVVMAPVAPARWSFFRRQEWLAAAACLTLCILLAGVLVPKLGRMRESSHLAADVSEERPSQLQLDRQPSEIDHALRNEPPPPASRPVPVPQSVVLGGELSSIAVSPKPAASPEPGVDSLSPRTLGRVDADARLEQSRTRTDGPVVGGAGGSVAGEGVSTKAELTDFRKSSFGNYRELSQVESKEKGDAPRRQSQFEEESGRGRLDKGEVASPSQEAASPDATGYASTATISGSRANAKNLELVGLESSESASDDELEPKKSVSTLDVKDRAKISSRVEEVIAAREPVSTFSLHVSDVSFRLAQAALARGSAPVPETIRPEEFYNAFDYGDAAPTAAEKIACRIEQAAHPFLQQRNLVRVAMRVPATGRGAGQPLRLTVLLDASGSMEREDRAASLRRAIEVLASLLGANDRVNLISFARQPRMLVEQLPGDQAGQLVDLIARTPAEGGTNLEEALRLAGEFARRHQDPAAQNRVVLITDGAANLGNADPAQLAERVVTLRQQGIAFDACGVGTDGLDDAILEALTRKGDGRYYVLDSPADADAGFARQLAGAFRPAAENVKVQVRFNPARVARYRLIGFEQHRLREEDFRDDTVDAAELAAEEAAVALYQVEVIPEGEGELGDVFVRFRDATTGAMVERTWTMPFDPGARAFDRSTPAMQLVGTAALLAEKLRGGGLADQVRLADLAPVVNALRAHFSSDSRVQALVAMFEQMRRLSGE